MCLQAADAPALPAGLDFDLLSYTQGSVLQSSGDDCAEAGDGEDAVDRQSRSADVAQFVTSALRIQRSVERGENLRQASASDDGAGNDGGAGESGSEQPLGNLLAHEVEP